MPAECCSTGPVSGGRVSGGRVSGGRAASSLTLALGVGLALVPKCPMCLAAYLSLFGLGMTAASVLSPWCAPLALALILAALLGLARSLRRRPARARLAPAPQPPSSVSCAPVM